ncbi:MAG TPA: PepSY domain-containing protein [Methylophilaceae bacterium]|jgi:uncharacterized membrane protein YkoI
MNGFNRMIIAAGLTALLASPALAGTEDPAKMRVIAESLGLISLEEATAKALAAKPGTIIEVELDDRKWPRGWDYEFEIIDADGREWDVDIDAKTGEVRKVKADWF